MKKLLSTLSILILFGCTNFSENEHELTDFVPADASLILKINDLATFMVDLENNDLHTKLKAKAALSQFDDLQRNLDMFQTNESLLLCLEQEKDSSYFTIITRMTDSLTELRQLDSLKLFHKVIDSIFIASNSKTLLAKIKAEPQKPPLILSESIDTDNSFSLLLRNKSSNAFGHALFQSDSLSFANQALLEVVISPERLLLNGVAQSYDSSTQLSNLFRGLDAQENTLQNVIPSNADGYLSFTYDNFRTLHANLEAFNSKKTDSLFNPELYQTVNEVGQVFYKSSNLIVLRSIDPSSTKEALRNYQTVRSTFRSVDIVEFSEKELFHSIYSPLINSEPVSYYCNLDDFFVFGNSESDLQNFIAHYQNGTTLRNDPAFESCMLDLSDESSLIIVANSNRLRDIMSNWFNVELSQMPLNDYKLSAFQMVQDKGFAHFNGVIKKHKKRGIRNTITEVFNVWLDADIIMSPQFVKNHRSRQQDIVVQDVNNTLYLISNSGKVLWDKKLTGAVLGKIEQVDLYRNGRLQLAFATENRVYVIDRNGNDVSPFPLKFNDKITQPLSVFDYDNDKRYRLVVTQSNNILLYNSKAQLIRGFNYNYPNDIVTQPKHFRVGSKDYIVFGAGNKMQILNRRGQTRIDVREPIEFSGQEIYFYNNSFTTTTSLGELFQLRLDGKMSKQSLGLGSDHFLDATSRTLVTLNENNLAIKKNTIALDFGNYTAPKIFYLNDKIYVSMTDLQTQKIYLFDSQSKPIPNFPVYGNSTIDLVNMDADSNLEFVTVGEPNSIVVYKKN